MNSVDELLRVCRAMTVDGELSGDEVWMLAKWLNDHPHATESWPGDILANALNEVFSHGEINPAELYQIAECLETIEQEASSRAALATPTDDISDDEAVPPIQPLPLLPSARLKMSMECSMEARDQTVDICDHTCTCEEWKRLRSGFPARHIKRMCKHVAMALLESKDTLHYDGLMCCLIETCVGRARGTTVESNYVAAQLHGGLALLSHADGEWVNVYAPNGNKYERYTYSLHDKRWSFGHSPTMARSLRALIDAKWTLAAT